MLLNRGAANNIAYEVHTKFVDHTHMPSNHTHFCANLAVMHHKFHEVKA